MSSAVVDAQLHRKFQKRNVRCSKHREDQMRLRADYDHTYRYVRKNERALTYDIGYHVYQRSDGSYVYGFEVARESSEGWFGSGASPLDFEGPRHGAEARVRELIEQQIECLPEHYESERFNRHQETDESVVTDGWLIRRIYGYWPAFHDAQLLEVSLRRYALGDKQQADMEMCIHHGGQDNPEWNGENLHCKLTFQLKDVAGDEFSTEEVNVPNWINDMRFSRRDDGRIDVDVEPSAGLPIFLHCAVVRLVSVEPYTGKEFI